MAHGIVDGRRLPPVTADGGAEEGRSNAPECGTLWRQQARPSARPIVRYRPVLTDELQHVKHPFVDGLGLSSYSMTEDEQPLHVSRNTSLDGAKGVDRLC
jgi:hypothetical protein